MIEVRACTQAIYSVFTFHSQDWFHSVSHLKNLLGCPHVGGFTRSKSRCSNRAAVSNAEPLTWSQIGVTCCTWGHGCCVWLFRCLCFHLQLWPFANTAWQNGMPLRCPPIKLGPTVTMATETTVQVDTRRRERQLPQRWHRKLNGWRFNGWMNTVHTRM